MRDVLHLAGFGLAIIAAGVAALTAGTYLAPMVAVPCAVVFVAGAVLTLTTLDGPRGHL